MIPQTAEEADRRGRVGPTATAQALDLSLPGVFLMIDSLQTGGSERQFVALSQSLDRTRFRVSLGCMQRIGPLLEGLQLDQFPLGGNLYGFRSWKTRMDIGWHLRRHSMSVAQAFDFYSNLTLVPAARLAKIPVVIGSQRQLGDLLTPAQSAAQTMIFRWCDAVVCNSQAAAQHLIAGLSEKKPASSGTALLWKRLFLRRQRWCRAPAGCGLA